MGKKKIIIDNNNLISALGWGGNSRILLNNVIDGNYEWYISLNQIKELERVMNYPKFNFNTMQKNLFFEIIFGTATVINSKSRLNVIKEDPEDNMILECALDAKADFIISGDNHLLKLKIFSGIKILTVKEFLSL